MILELDPSNYTTNSEVKRAAGDGASEFAKNIN